MALHQMHEVVVAGQLYLSCSCGWSADVPDVYAAAASAMRAHFEQVSRGRDRAEAKLAEEIAQPDTRTEL